MTKIGFAGRGSPSFRCGRSAGRRAGGGLQSGYCARFYPNANCQNKGSNSPDTGDQQLRNQIRGAYAWGAGPCAMGARYYVGRGGRRYACY
jgi:hypothetical protein